ncbi:MAG: glycosyltransferase [Bacteroidales bacterium]
MMAQKFKKVIVSVTNDLVSDNRVHRTCNFFVEEGYDVLLVGRKLLDSLPVQRTYKTFRFRLIFNKKMFFYAEYNLRLFFLLLFHRCDLLVANDLDTLLANYCASKIKRCPLLYDSHEYFTEVPELVNRKRVKRIWEKIEQKIFPKLPLAVTVCDSIAEIYQRKYNIPVYSIRNVPILKKENTEKKDITTIFNDFSHLLLYQGALNIGRGIENLIDSMIYLDNRIVLLIIGKGDIEFDLHKRVKELKLSERVKFLGKVPIENLHAYTLNADLGFSLEEDRGLNYRFALPNKLFDYIQASVPVVCSDLPEMSKIVKKYNVGICLNESQRNPEKLAQIINGLLSEKQKLETWKANCKIAAKELNWEVEKEKLKSVLQKLID